MRNILICCFVLSTCTSFSQIEDLDEVVSDLYSLTNHYISPAADAISYQSSSGWFTSAKSKNLWEAEVSLQANWLYIPGKIKYFTVNESELQNISIQGDATEVTIPTVLGGETNVVLEGTIQDSSFEFDAPEGVDKNELQHYQIQIGLGLWKGTTLITRYAPNISIKDTKYQVLGVGLQHSISQWIPSLKNSSFALAALASYANYNAKDTFSTANLIIGEVNSFHVKGNTFQFIFFASKSIKDFDIATGLGVNTTNFKYKVGGTGATLLEVLNQQLKTLEKSDISYKVDLSLNYNLGDFSINTMTTFGKYINTVVGVNYNF